jgi:hypothetical protein
MRQIALGIVALLIIAGIVAGVIWQNRNTPQSRRARLVERFLAAIPDSLDAAHRDEIRGLMETFWASADRGKVAIDDVKEITDKMEDAAARGSIDLPSLQYLMAQVGYYTYKLQPEFTGGQVDHPTLNPEAGLVSLRDSAFWAEFDAWKVGYLRDHPEFLEAYPEYRESLLVWEADTSRAQK